MKRRIFLGLAPILVLLAGIGVYAIVLLKALGGKIDLTLKENYRSVVAGRQMKESLQAMDSGLVFTLVGETDRGTKIYELNQPIFAKNLVAEEHNITLPGEQQLADTLRQEFTTYQSEVQHFNEISDPDQKRQFYFSTVQPLGAKIKDTAQQVIHINEENMLNENQGARSLGNNSSRYLSLAVAIGILASLFFAYWLQRSIVRSLHTLTSVAKELGEGNLDQLVPVASHDEMGELAAAFN
jgi:two-component system, NtrC family, sensor histidine kinase KinB